MAELHRRTEGWPVGLYLAALYLREGGSLAERGGVFRRGRPAGQRVRGVGVPGADLPPAAGFLTRTAVLERMSGPLCDAVLGLPGSATVLADLAQSNLLLVPLDQRGQWYRYHHLFRDMLLAELERHRPEPDPRLAPPGGQWCLRNGLLEEALEYFIEGGDVDAAARLVGGSAFPLYRQGRFTTLQRWFGWLDDQGGHGRAPMVAVLAAMFFADDRETGRSRTLGRCRRSLAAGRELPDGSA